MSLTISPPVRAVLLGAAALLPSSAWRAAEHAPQQARVVALMPVDVRMIRDSSVIARAGAFDSLIELVVRDQGFGVVPHDSCRALAAHVSDSLGGAFDPVTGREDTVRARGIEDATHRALQARYGAELQLLPFVIVEPVPFKGDKVTWRGTTEKTGAAGGVEEFLFGTKYGKIPALSLFVFVEDTTGRTLYHASAGIQLAMKAGRAGGKPALVPATALLADTARNAHAVHLALDSLAARLGLRPAPALQPIP